MNQTFSKKLKIYQDIADFSFIDTLTISLIQKNRYSDQNTAESVVKLKHLHVSHFILSHLRHQSSVKFFECYFTLLRLLVDYRF